MLSSQMKAFVEGTEFHQCLWEHGPVPTSLMLTPYHKAPSSHQQSATFPPLSLSPLCPHPYSAPRSPVMASLSFRIPIPSCPSHLHKDPAPAPSHLSGS